MRLIENIEQRRAVVICMNWTSIGSDLHKFASICINWFGLEGWEPALNLLIYRSSAKYENLWWFIHCDCQPMATESINLISWLRLHLTNVAHICIIGRLTTDEWRWQMRAGSPSTVLERNRWTTIQPLTSRLTSGLPFPAFYQLTNFNVALFDYELFSNLEQAVETLHFRPEAHDCIFGIMQIRWINGCNWNFNGIILWRWSEVVDNDVNDAIFFPRVSGSRIMKRKPRLDRADR